MNVTAVNVVDDRGVWTVPAARHCSGRCAFSYPWSVRGLSWPWGVVRIDKWEAVLFWKLLIVCFLQSSQNYIISFYGLNTCKTRGLLFLLDD